MKIDGVAEAYRIAREVDRAARIFSCSWKKNPGNGSAPKMTARKAKRVQQASSCYLRNLRRVARRTDHGSEKCGYVVEARLLCSFDARVCASLVSLSRITPLASADQLLKFAKGLNVREKLLESLLVEWKSTPKMRPIQKPGPARRALQVLVRNALLVQGEDSPFDYSRRGAGGEKAFIAALSAAIASPSAEAVWTSDVRKFFQSLKPGHLAGCSIDRRIIRNVAFTPVGAQVRIKWMLKQKGEIVGALRAAFPDTVISENVTLKEMRSLTSSLALRGLQQGSVLSPLLARGFLGRELKACLEAYQVTIVAYVDDVVFVANTKAVLVMAQQEFITRLSTAPSGPIELHPTEVQHKGSNKLHALGYHLKLGNGHGNNPVHVKPGAERFKRFYRGLAHRLDNDSRHYSVVTQEYWERWYQSQGAWTKVPGFTEDISWVAAMTFAQNYAEAKKPKFTPPKIKLSPESPHIKALSMLLYAPKASKAVN